MYNNFHIHRKPSSSSAVIGYTMSGNGSVMSMTGTPAHSTVPSPIQKPQAGTGPQQKQQPDIRSQQGQPIQQANYSVFII